MRHLSRVFKSTISVWLMFELIHTVLVKLLLPSAVVWDAVATTEEQALGVIP